MPPLLELQAVTKRFGAFTAVNDVSLAVAPGEFLTLLGASGSGKTTTLRMIAGFEHPEAGEILMDGLPITGLPPYRRDLNTVFQQYALFPHMTVRENVGYGLRMRNTSKSEIADRVAKALDMVQLGSLAERAPRQLSGGQQQRVALARALVNRPRVLLLDEPLGALDLKLRKEMQLELKHLNRQLGITFLYVTHDQEEALTMSDRVALMRQGRIEQLDPPKKMYERPVSKYVADFIGETNLLGGSAARRLGGSAARLVVSGQELEAMISPSWNEAGASWLAVRPEHIRVADPAGDGPNRLDVTVTEAIFSGQVTRVYARLADGNSLVMHWPAGEPAPAPGTRFQVTWPVDRGLCVGD
jgi:spermidine/putrescine transport system ATP-binding protein